LPANATAANEDQNHGITIADLMITTEAMVAEAPKKDEPMGGGHGGGGMGGMGGMDF
jgi:chaperonin GroEL